MCCSLLWVWAVDEANRNKKTDRCCGLSETVEKLRFFDNLCFDFAKYGRPKVPMRKLSPSQGIQTEVHAPGLDAFAQQTLLNARSRAAAVPA